MPSEKRRESVSLDTLAAGKLPERVTKAINEMELTVEEVVWWESSKSPFYAILKDNHLTLQIRLRIPFKKKLLAAIGGVGSVLWMVVTNLDKFTELAKLLRNDP